MPTNLHVVTQVHKAVTWDVRYAEYDIKHGTNVFNGPSRKLHLDSHMCGHLRFLIQKSMTVKMRLLSKNRLVPMIFVTHF